MRNEEEATLLEAYKASLNELNSNCKIKINGLTMVADENRDHAIAIAACIERQLQTVPNHLKLPVLYLIDSICKNFPRSMYVQLFTQNIVSNFCNVFRVSNEKVRKSLYKLKVTWNRTKIFPQDKLLAIDRRAHEMDPNWPVERKIPGPTQTAEVITQPIAQPPPPPPPIQTEMLIQTLPPPQPQPVPIPVPVPVPVQQTDMFIPPLAPPPLQSDVFMQPIPPIQTGLLIQPLPPPPPPPPQQPAPVILAPVSTQPMELYQSTVLDSLYGGKQCSNCSLRFDDNNRYAIHLDWHFRQNLKSDTTFARRKWYYPLNLWVQFREINDDDPQDNDNFVNDVTDLLLPVKDCEVPTASASKDDEKNICSVCHETFEKYWAEEEEEWRLKNAKLHEDERVYHPLCLMDMLKTTKSDLA